MKLYESRNKKIRGDSNRRLIPRLSPIVEEDVKLDDDNNEKIRYWFDISEEDDWKMEKVDQKKPGIMARKLSDIEGEKS